MLLRSFPLLAVMAVAAVGLDPALVWGQDSLPLNQTAPTNPSGSAIPPQSDAPSRSVIPPQTYSLVHVSAVAGSNTGGDGTQLRPYQTITHALEAAPANSVVVLAAGEYSLASGEEFPLYLKPGITLQGSPAVGTNQSIIRGSGIFPSATGRLMPATVVGVDGAGLGNVTITNTSTSGYGLIVEGGSPIIRNNTFTGSGYGGAYVAGPGAPVIEGNYFSQNGVVGLVIAEQSTAQVQGNLFENTGTGIRVAPGAQPSITNNRIVQNQDGLILDSSAQPRLQDNIIAQNRRNGLVEFQTATKADTAIAGAASPQPVASPPVVSPPAALRQSALTPASFAVEAVLPQPGSQNDTPAGLAAPPRAAALASTMPSPPAMGGDAPIELPSPAPAQPPDASQTDAPQPDAAQPDAEIALARVIEASQVEVNPENHPDTLPFRVSSSPEPLGSEPSGSRPSESESIGSGPSFSLAMPSAEPSSESSGENSVSGNLAEPRAEIAIRPPAESLGLAAANGVQPDLLPSAPVAQPPTQTDALAAIHARLRQQRQTGQTPSPEAALSVPIQVIPPPVDTLARANIRANIEETATLNPGQATENQPATETAPISTGSRPDFSNPAGSPLQVPTGNIPLGQGGNTLSASGLENIGTSLPNETSPPPPPSRASMLGLVYRVLVSATDTKTQNQLRDVVPDAFRISFDNQVMMQAGAYADRATAEAMATELMQQGFEARIAYIP